MYLILKWEENEGFFLLIIVYSFMVLCFLYTPDYRLFFLGYEPRCCDIHYTYENIHESKEI
jgi:hypothetical protein